jgi:hypothetical protein
MVVGVVGKAGPPRSGPHSFTYRDIIVSCRGGLALLPSPRHPELGELELARLDDMASSLSFCDKISALPEPSRLGKPWRPTRSKSAAITR